MISRKEKFLHRIQQVTETHLTDRDFDVKALCQEMKMSQPTLWRKVSEVTRLAPQQYIREVRLAHAGKMLAHDVATVSEIAETVGFSNKSHFSKCFKESFGIVPSLYRSQHSTTQKDHKVLTHQDWNIYKDN